jgi:methyltransferase (TIGR00027 family)
VTGCETCTVRAGRASRTAEYVALFRALETARPPGRRLFADALAASFLTRPLRAGVAVAALPVVGGLVPALIDWRWPGPRPSAIARTRILDDAVERALARGLDQLVLLGAGYDSRPYRLAGAREVTVFEVDHPATQTVKRRVVAQLFGELPAHVRFVPVDFDGEDLGTVMTAAGLEAGRRTYILWEGVLAYLTPEAVDATMRWAGAIAGPGSELAFTYVHQGLLDGTGHFPHATAWTASVRTAGEPFVFGLDPHTLGAFLIERGWRLREDLSTPEALAQHGRSIRRVPSFYRIARAAPTT